MGFLMYRTTKLIKVDVWQMGLLYYILAGAILAWQVSSVYNSGSYLLQEPIIGSVNPFAVDSTYDTVKAAAKEANYDYCMGASAPTSWQTIDVGDDFVYSPRCENLHKYEVGTKQTDFISFISSMMKYQTYGWPCGAENQSFATEALAKCDAGTQTTGSAGGQCGCSITYSLYPTAVEDYSIDFAHGYAVSELQGRTWSGQSAIPASQIDDPYKSLDTTIRMPDGTVNLVKGGADLRLKLKDLIAMGRLRDGSDGMTLDDINEEQTSADGTKNPHMRTTGLTINVIMDYTNRQPGLNLAFSHDVDVTLRVEIPSKLWTSTGPRTTYPVQPYARNPSDVGRYYHRVIDYPQNVNVNFKDVGYAVALDANYLLTVFVKIIVLVGVAKTVMDFIVFNMLPNGVSTVLKNKREEVTNRQRAFAELGLKAAITVGQFNRLDDNNNGRLKLADLTKVFGSLEHVGPTEAMQIAKTVMKKAKAYSDGSDDGKDGIDFGQFMSISEGSAITFDRFLDLVHKTGKMSASKEDEKAAMVAYAEAAKGVVLDEEQGGGKRKSQVDAEAAGATYVPKPPVMPPGVQRAMCHACKKPFGVPIGATMVACPHCQTVNQLNQTL